MTVTLGLHMISRSETDRLAACLASLEPIQFDQVVVGITSQEGWGGETRQIAEKYGQAVDLTWLPKLTFPEYGECIASFAQARQAVYDQMTTDWVFWIDSDDVLDGADQLRPIIERIDGQGFGCLFLDYWYGFDNSGNCITILKRERAVKRSVGWKWIRRVHEGMMAQGPVQFAKTDDVIVKHNSPTGRGWPKRNLELLLLDYEENPNDKRTVCYIGHQYYATQDWSDAAGWYEKYIKMEDRTIEKWQGLHFLADCYRQTGRFPQSINADLQAMLLIPGWADPYFGLAETYARMGDWDKVLHWDNLGRIAKPASDAIFFNPLDYNYNPALFSNVAWANKGDLDKARQVVAAAAEVAPAAEHLQQQLANYDALIQQRDKAKGLMKLWEGAPDDVILKTPVPKDLLEVPVVKERITHAAHQIRRPGRPWAVFFCGKSLENWGPPSLTQGGIGGSETAVIWMAQLLGKHGWHVDVYNMPGMYMGTYDDVGYWPFQWFDANVQPELLVGWRQNGALLADYDVGGLVKFLYVHDLHMGDLLTPERANFYDRVMPVSEWHGSYLNMLYPFLDNVKATRNGIDLARFDQEVERNPYKVVFSSSPDRGMLELLKMWPMVVRVVPQAQLHLYYGFNNIDRYPQMASFKQHIEMLLQRTPNVTWHGRVNQDELAREFLSAGVWAYPTAFLEVSCCVGNTLIDMPRDYSKYPKGVPISELVGESGFPVWVFNEDTGSFELAPVKWVAKTRENTEVWQVTWDDGTHLRATPDHLVLTYDRGWVQLQDLQPGESVLALRKVAYIQVGTQGGKGKWEQEHRAIARWKYGDIPEGAIVDHVDDNSWNNTPDNLQLLSRSEHATKTFTGKKRTPQAQEHITKAWLQKWDEDPEFRAERTAHLCLAGQKLWEKVNAMPDEERKAWLRQRALRRAASERANEAELSPDELEAKHQRRVETGRQGAKKRWDNHKVVRVAPWGRADVYNMEIDGPPNFVAGGVVIHNCITAMEAMAAGCAILTSDCGALPETVGDRGILVPGHLNTEPYRQQFVGHLVGLLQNEEWRAGWAAKGLAHTENLSWEKVAEEWIAEWERSK